MPIAAPAPEGSRPLPATVHALGLVEHGHAIPAFASLTRLAVRTLGAPVALISFMDDAKGRSVFASQEGLGEPWASLGEAPQSHALCAEVRSRRAPLAVDNAPEDQEFARHPAVRRMGVAAYLGMPLHAPDGTAIGAMCAVEDEPRAWTDYDRSVLADLAGLADDAILLRAHRLACVH